MLSVMGLVDGADGSTSGGPDSESRDAVIPVTSVVVGSVESARSISRCLASIFAGAPRESIEVILVDASADDTASIARREFPAARVIAMPVDTLTPVLWAAGISAARGQYVALTTGHCVVAPGWTRSLGNALDSGAAGAGGPIALADDASLLDAAIYFLRYSAFMPPRRPPAPPIRDIAGDNAMYRRDVLDRHAPSFAGGFWEKEFHEALFHDGEHLSFVTAAAARFGRSFPLRVISRHRFEHGRRFGAWRATKGGESVIRVCAAAPVVPIVMLARIANRVYRDGAPKARFVLSTPAILWLAACWATGEAAGAWRARHADRG